MAKARMLRRRIHSRRIRARPYKFPYAKRLVARKMFAEDCPKCLEKREWENVICSVCMECPHNAVLLLCSSHDKGCRPYMCGTSFRYSNCLDQYKKASAKLKPSSRAPPTVNKSELGNLTCPLCRGQVKGWTIVQPARNYLNLKKRICMQENCVFSGTFRELRKHMRVDHPCAKPREVDPDVEQKWRRLEIEHDRDDAVTTIRSTMPGSMVFGDYVIEHGSDSDDGRNNGGGVIDAALGRSLVNVFLLLHAFEDSESSDLAATSNHGTVEMDFSDDEDRRSNSLASRMRRQGRTLLGRSGRRRRNREANQSPGPP
uniref:DUF1644 domain-containing protein n=1 Tax=Noccaea caerulescens TaxID=107243 RepID=A0A1J3G4L2_NOCCA